MKFLRSRVQLQVSLVKWPASRRRIQGWADLESRNEPKGRVTSRPWRQIGDLDATLTRIIGKSVSDKDASRIIERLWERRVIRGRRDSTLAIGLLGRNGFWSSAIAFMESLRGRGLDLDVIAYNATLKACERGSVWSNVLALLHGAIDHDLEGDIFTLNIAMSACRRAQQWQQALLLLHNIPADDVKPDVITFSTGITACEGASRWEMALVLLASMVDQKIRMDMITCNAAISVCEKGHQWQRSLHLVKVAAGMKLRPDVITYNATIAACGRGLAWERSISLFEGMRNRRLHPNTITYNSTIQACERGKQWERVLALVACMKSRKVFPDIISYNLAADTCVKVGNLTMGVRLLQDMEEQGLQADVATHSIAMGISAAGRNWQTVLELLRRSSQLHGGSAVLFGSALNAVGKCEQWQMAIHILGEMQTSSEARTCSASSQVAPTEIMLNSALSVCEKGGLWSRALSLLQEFHKNDLVLDAVAVTNAAAACAKAGEEASASATLLKLEELELMPDTASFGRMLNACRSGLTWSLSLDILQNMLQTTVSPDSINYNMSIAACGQTARWQWCLQLFDDMVPDLITCNEVVQALFSVGEVAKALALYREIVFTGVCSPWHTEEGGVLDLHRFQVHVAQVAVMAALMDLAAEGPFEDQADLVVVSGRGSHSVDGEAILTPTLLSWVRKDLGFTCRIIIAGRWSISTSDLRRWASGEG